MADEPLSSPSADGAKTPKPDLQARDAADSAPEKPAAGKIKLKLGKPGSDKAKVTPDENLPEPPAEALNPSGETKPGLPPIKARGSKIKGTAGKATEPGVAPGVQIKGTKPKLKPRTTAASDEGIITSSGRTEDKSGLVVAATKKKGADSSAQPEGSQMKLVTGGKKKLPPTKVAIPPTRMMKSKGATERHNMLERESQRVSKSKSFVIILSLACLIGAGAYLVKTGEAESLISEIKRLNALGGAGGETTANGTAGTSEATQEDIENFIKELNFIIRETDGGAKLMVGSRVVMEGDFVSESLGLQFAGADTRAKVVRFRDLNGQLYGKKY